MRLGGPHLAPASRAILLIWALPLIACSTPTPGIDAATAADAAARVASGSDPGSTLRDLLEPGKGTPDTPPDLALLLVTGLREDSWAEPSAAAAFLGDGAGSVRFTAAYAQSPSDLPSTASLLTGLYTSRIPICGLFRGGFSALWSQEHMAGARRPWCTRIPEDRRSLPEVLALYGYRTALVTSGLPAPDVVGDRFESWFDVERGGSRTDWPTLRTHALEWWREDPSRPRLLVVVIDDLQVGRHDGRIEALGMSREDRELLTGGYRTRPWSGAHRALVGYADMASRAGAGMRGLHSTLVEDGARPVWTILGSASGLSLFEQSGFEGLAAPPLCTSLVLDRTVHVPLALLPPAAGEGSPVEPLLTVNEPVQLLDLFPTLSELAGTTAPAELPGHSLFDRSPGDGWTQDAASDTAASYAYAEFGDTLTLREGRFVLAFRGWIHAGNALDPRLLERLEDPRILMDPPRLALFDVEADPLQQRDLRRDEPEVFARMWARMIEIRRDVAAPPVEDHGQDKLEHLSATSSGGYW